MTSWALSGRLGVWSILQHCRQYSRRLNRNPRAWQGANELQEDRENAASDTHSSVSFEGSGIAQHDRVDEEESRPLDYDFEKARLPPGFPPFHKKGKDDSDLSRLALDTSGVKQRRKSGLIRLEGKRLIQEAFDAQLHPKGLFFSRLQDVVSLQLPPLMCLFQKVTYDRLQRWSKVTTTSGLIAFFKMPDTSQFKSNSSLPFSIICDNVRDPGNLGSIIRIAASAGCKKVLLTQGCVDLWNEKVLRTAMGSHFHLNIQPNMKWDAIKEELEPESCVMFADNKGFASSQQEEVVNDDGNDESDCLKDLPTFPYYQVAYPQISNIYLVVGGETQGLSKDALSCKESHKCFRVTIPMLNKVESLNVSSALAILTHEIKRQFELFGDSNTV
ncbi:rRNA methyltransferase 3A, mitochondrial [Thrips palmi]|uniref:rRNA methyltransferase 3A, mitochondrial n=1 Tax=Thrips palmi TaxID=161013 RepID=A0A6P9A1P6_THRPL|nr:rRNA methyltransferase 3A, mitochondrial [Thrips palmi]